MSCRLLDSSLEKYLHPKRLALGETNSHRNLKKNSPTLSFARDGVDLVVAFISIPYQFPNRSLMTSVYPLIPIRPDSPNGADKDAAFLLFTVQQYPVYWPDASPLHIKRSLCERWAKGICKIFGTSTFAKTWHIWDPNIFFYTNVMSIPHPPAQSQ
ncbi:uncharacterized protein [Gossypium hirsutum]|uniref:Uncharacterized protein LOC107918100 isoform X1 n=1 Tax=Gossypium hirsutum TaxID=3635 RepID=A0A1U8KQ20_GOSHI|nr:uncharacterized protein LOC107918100 isoform X1 [Gossypium hirsutum]XP_016703099.1 uncharacterized protein LOC107918100 isoform X1 [Gossypium hirsutum]